MVDGQQTTFFGMRGDGRFRRRSMVPFVRNANSAGLVIAGAVDYTRLTTVSER